MTTPTRGLITKWRSGEAFLFSIVVLALFYPWYRYPFQISSTETSPGYSDTPTYLQIGKFALFGLLVFIKFGVSAFRPSINDRIPLVNVILSLAAIYLGLAPMLYVDSKLALGHAMSGLFWITVPLMLLANHDRELQSRAFSFSELQRLLRFFFHISIVFLILEVGLFFSTGRLPALSFSDSPLVRFGGLWDDPNGFSVFLAFFVPMAFFGMRGVIGKLAAIISVGILLVGTQSGTGIISVTLAFLLTCIVCFLFDRHSKSYIYAIVLPLVFFLAIVIVVLSIDNLREALFGLILLMLDLKSGSIDAHSSSIGVASDLTFLTAIGLAPLREVGESAYVNFLTNFGIQYIIVFIFLSLIFMIGCMRVLRHAKDPEVRTLMQCILCFELAFLLSLINLPLDHVFPVNLLFITLGTTPFLISSRSRSVPLRRTEASWPQ